MRKLTCDELKDKKIRSCDIQTATLEYAPCGCRAGVLVKDNLVVCPQCQKVLGETVEMDLTKHIACCSDCAFLTPEAWDHYFVDTV